MKKQSEIRLKIVELEERIAPSPAPGLLGDKGQPGNQGGHGGNGNHGTPNGLRGYEASPAIRVADGGSPPCGG